MKRFILGAGLLSLALSGCGYEGVQLSPAQKRSEMDWVFTVFDHNYAPRDWKNQNLGVAFDDVRRDCTNRAEQSRNNGEFRAIVKECVSRFQDGHTSISQMGSLLPEVAEVAYLGFLTDLTRLDGKEALRVTKILPTSASGRFPLYEGDLIVSVDGKPIADVLRDEIVRFRNVGQPDANLAIAAMSFAVRTTLNQTLPEADEVTLQISRSAEPYNLTLPWTKSDMMTFMERLAFAKVRNGEMSRESEASANRASHPVIGERSFFMGFEALNDMIKALDTLRTDAGSRARFLLRNTFKAFHLDPYLKRTHEIMASEGENSTIALPLPELSFDIGEDMFTAKIFFSSHNPAEKIGYLKIPSFGFGEEGVMSLQNIISKFNSFNIKGLVIDTLDNGGGSLVHGALAANLLTERELKLPSLEVALNSNWLNGFRSEAAFGSTDAERAWASRIVSRLKKDIEEGRRLSRPIPTQALDPYSFINSKRGCADAGLCLKPNVTIALMINEFCASMCDIYASIFKDNNLGQIVGSQSMGAGGNVTMHGFSPIAKFMLSQTESLIVDANGQYLENKGVIPHVITDTISDRHQGYATTFEKALAIVDPAPAAQP